ncbi:MAG TPA: BrnA antitoxin family protein [Bryobacteraceae bacterium]|nr:BrnA antitoxin family protein [Bryobacteraceae bacterium]
MAKKSSVSSQPARLKSTEKERRALLRIAALQAAADDSQINLDDLPRLSEAQLASMLRLRETRQAKVPVSLRLDPQVLAWLKSKGAGHLTRINDILTNVMEAERRSTGR